MVIGSKSFLDPAAGGNGPLQEDHGAGAVFQKEGREKEWKRCSTCAAPGIIKGGGGVYAVLFYTGGGRERRGRTTYTARGRHLQKPKTAPCRRHDRKKKKPPLLLRGRRGKMHLGPQCDARDEEITGKKKKTERFDVRQMKGREGKKGSVHAAILKEEERGKESDCFSIRP